MNIDTGIAPTTIKAVNLPKGWAIEDPRPARPFRAPGRPSTLHMGFEALKDIPGVWVKINESTSSSTTKYKKVIPQRLGGQWEFTTRTTGEKINGKGRKTRVYALYGRYLGESGEYADATTP